MATQDTPSTARTSRDVLHERLRSLTYEVDHTAANPANHVVETRTLTDANRSPFNHIIPKAAPFFAHTVRIFHTQTNDELINGQDFYCVGTFVKAVTNVVHHREVNWAIIFDDKRISGEYRIEYQTVGGEFVLDQQQMAEILANFVENPRSTDWESIVGRPLAFPPLPHDVHVDDLKGFNEQVEATHGVEEAIRALLRDEEQDHPGYAQVITELFRQQQRQDKFQQSIDEIRVQNTNSSANITARFTSETERIEAESKTRDRELENRIATDLTEKLNRLDADYKAADNDLTGKLTKVKTDLVADIGSKDSALRTLIDQKDNAQTSARSTAINALTETLNATAADIRREFQAGDRTLDGKIESLRSSTTSAIASSLENAKAYTDSKFGAAISNLNSNVGNLSTSNAALEAKIAENKKTSDEAEASLRRDLTAEVSSRTEANRTLDGKIESLRSSTTSAIASSLENAKAYTDSKFGAAISNLNSNVGNLSTSNAALDTKLGLLQNGVASLTESLKTKETALSGRIETNKNNHDSLASQFNALKSRVDNNSELLKTGDVNQEIRGEKTFTKALRLKNADGGSSSALIGFNNTDVYIHNPASNSYFQMRNNGKLEYNNKRILLIDDFNTLNDAINGVRSSLGNYVPTNGNHTINNEKTFTSRIKAPRVETDNIGHGGFVSQYGTSAPFYVNHFNNNNQSTYYPFVKGRIQNNNNGWSAAVSFGALGHPNMNHYPDGIIHARTDVVSGEDYGKVWRFETSTGNFISSNDVIAGGDIRLSNAVLKTTDQDIAGRKKFTDGEGIWVVHGGRSGRLNHDSISGYIQFFYGENVNPHMRIYRASEGKVPTLHDSGSVSGQFIMQNGEQTIEGTKYFKHWIRLKSWNDSTNNYSGNGAYSEFSSELDANGNGNFLRFFANNGRGKAGSWMSINQDGLMSATFGNFNLSQYSNQGNNKANFHYSGDGWVFHFNEGTGRTAEGKERNPHWKLAAGGLSVYGTMYNEGLVVTEGGNQTIRGSKYFKSFFITKGDEENHSCEIKLINGRNGRTLSLDGHGDENNGRLSVQDLYVRSDARIKTNLAQIREPLFKLDRLNGYTYNLLNKGEMGDRSAGLIAQEVMEVLPDIVKEFGEDKPLVLQYNGIIALLVEGVKELNGVVKQQAERIRILEEKLNV